MSSLLTSLDDLFNTQEERDTEKLETVVNIPLSEISDFPDHPSKVRMAFEFDVLDGIPDKRRGMGAIICMLDRKLYLRENLVALPLEYL